VARNRPVPGAVSHRVRPRSQSSVPERSEPTRGQSALASAQSRPSGCAVTHDRFHPPAMSWRASASATEESSARWLVERPLRHECDPAGALGKSPHLRRKAPRRLSSFHSDCWSGAGIRHPLTRHHRGARKTQAGAEKRRSAGHPAHHPWAVTGSNRRLPACKGGPGAPATARIHWPFPVDVALGGRSARYRSTWMCLDRSRFGHQNRAVAHWKRHRR
jgi:hypothetical protein